MNKEQKQDEFQMRMKEREMALAGSMAKIKNKFMVMSGKGGVGKSCVAANLAIALSERGYAVGLLDIDLHGPSIPKIMGIRGQITIPMVYTDNLKVVSIEAMLQDKDAAVIWRGPIKLQAIRSFLTDIEWGELDYLIADSPPGTGDEPLTIAQYIPDSKAIIVTTPQEIALQDIRKSINFCRQVNMEIFGVIENMSGLVCPHCGGKIDLFKIGGGERTAQLMMVPFLGRIPVDPEIVEATDSGRPYLVHDKNSAAGKAFLEIVNRILERTAKEAKESVPSAAKTEIGSGATSGAAKAIKIAIPLEQGRLSSHFGHCEEFAFIDLDDKKIQNKELVPPPPHEPGALPRWLHEHEVNVVIAGGMGQRAQDLFAEQDIKVIIGAPKLTPEELVSQYINGTLVTGPNICDH